MPPKTPTPRSREPPDVQLRRLTKPQRQRVSKTYRRLVRQSLLRQKQLQ
jgi:hypothetical protein